MMIDEQPRINRLLLFNLATDADDVALGFAISWITELSKHVKAIDVITMRVGRYALPENVCVYSVGKEKGYSEPRRFIEFYRIFFRLLRKNRYDGCFAHMMQLFAVMAAPFLRWQNIPLILWYAHKSVTPMLRLATFFADRIVTASPESFRIASPNVCVIGHGIDTDRFLPSPQVNEKNRPFTVLTVGRLSKSKRVEVLIDAVALFRQHYPEMPICLNIVGTTATAHDAAYVEYLHQFVLQQSLSDVVHFVGSVSFQEVVTWYQQADCFLSASDTGSLDKAVLEAMSCGLPILAPAAYAGMLGAAFASRLVIAPEPAMICERLRVFAALSRAERRRIGAALREIVMRDHALATICERIFQELHRG